MQWSNMTGLLGGQLAFAEVGVHKPNGGYPPQGLLPLLEPEIGGAMEVVQGICSAG